MRSVSIIIPAYNVGQYVKKCVSSVMAQTYNGPIECLIVDDCSTDDTFGTINELVKDYRGSIDFRIIKFPKNLGVSAARNAGIMEAKHEFIYFLDGDDQIVPDSILKMMRRIELHPDCQCVFAGFASSDTSFLWMDYTRKTIREFSNDRDWVRRALLHRFLFTTSSCNRMILRKLILENKIFFRSGLRYEDELWNFELSKYLQSAAVILENTYIYVPHSSSFMHSVRAEERWKNVLYIVQLMLRQCSKSRNERKDEVHSIMSFMDDHIRLAAIPRSVIRNVQGTIRMIARQATFMDSILCQIYAASLRLPSVCYTNCISRKLFKKWIKIPV